MDSGRRIAVIGAGAWGLSVALGLLEAGATHVRVFERAQAGSGATALAAGLVSTHLRQSEDIRLVLETRRHLFALRAWGRENGRASAEHVYNAAGSVTIVPEDEQDKLVRLRSRIHAEGGEASFVSGPEIERRWPLTGLGTMTGLHTAQDGHVEAGDLVDLLQARVRDLGGKVAAERAVGVTLSGRAATGIASTEGPEGFDDVVMAAGAWSKAALGNAGLALPVKGYRTQLAQLGYPHRGRFPIMHDASLRVYARPDGPSAILMGDGTEFVESQPETFNRGVDQSFIEKVAESASMRLPNGGEAEFRRGWAGLCVATPDRDPIIGPYPGVAGLHLMVGDNGFGVMRCMALGAIAARAVRGGKPPPAYSPARFAMSTDFEIREGFEL